MSGRGGADGKLVTILLVILFVKKEIRPGAIFHSGSDLGLYGWLLADTRPYPIQYNVIQYNCYPNDALHNVNS